MTKASCKRIADIAANRGRDAEWSCKIFKKRRLLDVQLEIGLHSVERDRRDELAIRQFNSKAGDVLSERFAGVEASQRD